MAREIEHNQDQMYNLSEDDDGDLVLSVLAGGIGQYEVSLKLNARERARYEEEGTSYLNELAYDLRKHHLTRYRDRIRPG